MAGRGQTVNTGSAVSGQGGMNINRYSAADAERINNWVNEARSVMEEQFRRTGRGLSMQELEALEMRLNAKWGDIDPILG
jgi:hypothetical protein